MLLAFIVGCSGQNQQAAIRDRQLDYQAAYVEPKLKVPDELSSERVNESLRIPESKSLLPVYTADPLRLREQMIFCELKR